MITVSGHPLRTYTLLIGAALATTIVLAGLGYWPTIRVAGDQEVWSMLIGCLVSWLSSCVGAITLARVRALARRSGVVKDEAELLEHGDLKIDLHNAAVFRAGVPLELTDREARLAVTLFGNVGRLLSRDYLLESVWGLVPGIPTRTLDTHISRLRQKLGLTADHGWQLKAVYQHGYRLEKLDFPEDAG